MDWYVVGYLDKYLFRGRGRSLDRAFAKAVARDMKNDSHGYLDKHI